MIVWPVQLDVITAPASAAYAVVDSGDGRKLERVGSILVDRQEPQALWTPRDKPAWSRAHATFAADDDEEKGRWRQLQATPESWDLDIEGVRLKARLMAFRHLGVFPEQVPHWQWMRHAIETAKAAGETPRVLNLFGYTGAASLIAAQAGAEVTHVDASKKAIQWARDNQAASKLEAAPIRWIVDDARKFAAREVRRGKHYHVVLVDPPKFGRGPEGEVWDLFIDLPALLDDCVKLLAPKAAHLVLTAYAIRASALSLDGLVAEKLADRAGIRQAGELALADASGGRRIGTSLFVRWAASHG